MSEGKPTKEVATDTELVDFLIQQIETPPRVDLHGLGIMEKVRDPFLNEATLQVDKIADTNERRRLIEAIRRYRGPGYKRNDWGE